MADDHLHDHSKGMGNVKGKKSKAHKALAVVDVAATFSGHGLVAKALKTAVDAARGIRDSRVARMWRSAIDGEDDALTFTESVAASILKDGDVVGEAFVAAAQAAADAITPEAVAAIGLLARRFIKDGEPSRREYRALLALLRGLDATEFGALRRAMHAAARLPDDPIDSKLMRIPEGNRDGGRWAWDAVTGSNRVRLLEGELAPILVDAIEDLMLPARLGETTLAGDYRGRPKLVQRTVRILADIMVIEDDASTPGRG
jgi:hypothetical protein